MKYVFQTITIPAGITDPETLPGEQRGNCLQACVASIFDLDLEEVPHFVSYPIDEWWQVLEDFMARRNLAVTWVPGGPTVWNTPYLAGGKSRRGPWGHVVVEKNGELLHDPHPEGGGLDGPRNGVYILTPLDPAAQPFLGEE